MVTRSILAALGFLALGLGILGVFLPLLPTTPFVLVAAACFSKSSPSLHNYLITHRIFGQTIADWEQHGVIRIRAKIIAISMILLLGSYPLLINPIAPRPRFLAAATIICVILFISSRASEPRNVEKKPKPDGY